MCDKICAKKISQIAKEIEICDIMQNNKNYLFDKNIETYSQNKDICKDCEYSG